MNGGDAGGLERKPGPARERSGGEARPAPLDLAHLERQTMGDSALGREVLSLFMRQSLSTLERLAAAEPAQRAILAHGLKGSARGVGAFAVADCAEAIEREPERAGHIERLAALVEDVRAFVAARDG